MAVFWIKAEKSILSVILCLAIIASFADAWPVSRYEDGYRKEYDFPQIKSRSTRPFFNRHHTLPRDSGDESMPSVITISFVGKNGENSLRTRHHRPLSKSERTQGGEWSQFDSPAPDGNGDERGNNQKYPASSVDKGEFLPVAKPLTGSQNAKDDDTLLSEFFSGMRQEELKAPPQDNEEVSDIVTNAVPDEEYGNGIAHQSALAGIQNAKCSGNQVLKDGKCRNKARIS